MSLFNYGYFTFTVVLNSCRNKILPERGEVVEWLMRNCEGLGGEWGGGEEGEDVDANVGGWEEWSGGGRK